MHDMTPREIVEALDQHIIGQHEAKRAVAVAIRNRWRRRQLDDEVGREVYPKNIIMAGPTGCGKTEIARRLARLTAAPFVKVEASKFTEVGYHGRDVESMIRDLLDQAIALVRNEQAQVVTEKAQAAATDRLVSLLLPGSDRPGKPTGPTAHPGGPEPTGGWVDTEDSEERRQRTRDAIHEQLLAGALDDREVELSITHRPQTSVMFANMGLDQMDPSMSQMFEKLMPQESKRKRMKVVDARRVLTEQETEKLLDEDKITAEAVARTEQSGIVFLDEIDKIASPESGGKGSPDVSRQGVQRDLLPIVEGSAVNTRHGIVHTDHILFIAAGAFHFAKVSDLMPELQGRFPIRVELNPLTREDFVRILTEPKAALTAQQQALLGVEGLDIVFVDGAVDAIAELAAKANAQLENIGARRLMTIVEKVFDQINFDAPDRVKAGDARFEVTADYVNQQVGGIVKDKDLSKFVL